MDDENFRKELLNRLDQIIELLSSMLPEACLEEPAGEEEAAAPLLVTPPPTYLIVDEMQDDYRHAVQRWQKEKETGSPSS